MIAYAVAIYHDHVYHTWPYISDVAVISPEKCIVSQLFTFGTILMTVVVYFRYLVIKHTTETYSLRPIITLMNNTNVWLGFLALLGVSFISNYQKKLISTIHLLGVAMTFNLGGIYLISEIISSVLVYPKIGSKVIIVTRIAITSIYTICLVISGIFASTSFNKFNGLTAIKWLPEDAGYTDHVISAITEWITAICLLLYLITYAYEFKDVVIYKPVLELPAEVTDV
ncbi:Frag1/DRAM/Sfk1 family [Popillia japonica]|uniref:Frag1/DRAM/Sfk1 family n=1 Tax=Popillia japonica TaxID=7064 RepID=A0AAW1KD06_POPJA